MPRKGNVPKREVLPDPVYGSVVVAKLMLTALCWMVKKELLRLSLYDAFDRVHEATGEDALGVFEKH